MATPFTSLVAALPASVPFVGPEAQERAMGSSFRARLGANENAFGPSPKAVAAMAAAASEVWQYGDPENHDLRAAIAAHHGVAEDRIAIGEGIDGLLGLVVRMVVEAGTPVITSAGAYPTFNYHVHGFGGRLVTVPYRDDREDPAAILDAVRRENAPLAYFANPDNPMGTWHEAGDVTAMIDAWPQGAILCLDEAYVEFSDGVAPPIDLEHPGLIRMRTFSKAYGLAGARIGYAITTAELATAFNKVRNHFGVNRIAQAGALAALADEAYLAEVTGQVAAAKARIGAIAAAHGMVAIPSATNFVAIDTGYDGAVARALVAALGRRGVFVRMPFVAPQDRCIRISAAPDALLDVFEEALGPALADALAAAGTASAA
ncbi:pyridoxal phosphate-dependent aminotransferase [Acuticoccus sp. M5D2P5]|uniref:pyridoxal phosphate-dependent aminotransferase n=1 Tax=Acuticoccus kalidii TaxID=2910977 RepID=UPI001EFF8E95|nr:pyridoxal phosphate-dependent aminotransferase [Acuticoccus kalidii]MCF3935878.1 pyridoxal phosphate-dependent aminotransferase [Acuticoccus kalidii]